MGTRKLLKRIWNGKNPYEALEELRGERTSPEIPVDLANPLMDELLERNYLEEISNRALRVDSTHNNIAWVRINRLPLHPSQSLDYDLSIKWQQALSAIHSWGDKLIFILRRQEGETSLYIGLSYKNSTFPAALSRLQCALANCMPGIDTVSLGNINHEESNDAKELIDSIKAYTAAGAITGIPSIKSAIKSITDSQALDQLAFGIRRLKNVKSTETGVFDCPFSLIVIADPIGDKDITETIGRFQQISSDMHALVSYHVNETDTEGKSIGVSNSFSFNLSLGKIIGALAGAAGIPIPTSDGGVLPTPSGGSLTGDTTEHGSKGGTQGNFSLGYTRSYNNFSSVGHSRSVSRDYLNKFAQATERNCDAHCERLRQGRNFGFWNVGTTILADTEETVETVMGILRSVYSGDKTYLEPLRLHHLDRTALPTLQSFNLIPLLHPNITNDLPEGENWHVLGEIYQYVSTPITTEELSVVTSLPRKDVPGLRFVRSAARFANNPGECKEENALTLGNVVDYGQELKNEYKIDINSLVRHSLIVGSTGCGKTTTCKKIMNEVMKHNIPMLIIEPAKDEYVRWAVENNKNPKNKHINIYMPGMANLKAYGEDHELPKRLKLNPFQPAAIPGAPVDLLTRTEQFTSIFNASIPNGDILPVLIDETFNRYLSKHKKYGKNFTNNEYIIEDAELQDYPKLSDVLPIAQDVLREKNYSDEVARGLMAALTTRFMYLCRGSRGMILDVNRSTPYKKLFTEPTVINLSRIANASDKALIMSLLMLSLFEYATSSFLYDPDYAEKARANKLQHLTVVEEAHNVLRQPDPMVAGSGNAQRVVADMFGNMLSEIRSCGEGLMIIDQVPTRLIQDVVRNTNLKIVHKLSGMDDCQTMSQALGLMNGQEAIIPLLATGNVLIASDRDDAASWVKIKK